MTDDPKALALELERRGKPKTSVDARAAKALREQDATIRKLSAALEAACNLIDDAMTKEFGDEWTDVELCRDGSYRLSDARAALREQEGE